jgi:NAD(P)-dependent dehydrogenase (short-subunit alcohol dehydrogenase family)
VLVNNAGVATFQNLVSGDLDKIRLEMETHYFGTLNVVRAFASILAAAGGGAILNVPSALSWLSYDGANAYAAAKAAEWSLTNGIRLEHAAQKTLVTGLHTGSVDTDMMAGFDICRASRARRHRSRQGRSPRRRGEHARQSWGGRRFRRTLPRDHFDHVNQLTRHQSSARPLNSGHPEPYRNPGRFTQYSSVGIGQAALM